MRHCRTLLDDASQRGEAPRAHFAFIDDRINVYEGRPQLYGTQWRAGPHGLESYELDDPKLVDERRATLGLPTMQELRTSAPSDPPRSPDMLRAKAQAELDWRRSVGWIP